MDVTRMGIEEICAALEAGGVDIEVVNELVHDVADQVASDVNNAGLRRQVEWLREQGAVAVLADLT